MRYSFYSPICRAVIVAGFLALCCLLQVPPISAGTLETSLSSSDGLNLNGKAKVDSGILKLTDLEDLDHGILLPLQGSCVLPILDPGQRVESFSARFRALIGGGTERPAQGFSFIFAPNLSPNLLFMEGGGFTSGLVVSFDTVDNQQFQGASTTTEGNDPGDAPGVIVKFHGEKVAVRRFDGLRTGNAFVPVEVTLESGGLLSVSYNGVKLFDRLPVGYTPLEGRFAFGAGTEETSSASRDNHWIDDLSISTTTVAGAFVRAASPGGLHVRPDSQVDLIIEELVDPNVSLRFDDTLVTPEVTTQGASSTVRYQPQLLLGPGSRHVVALTFDGRTFIQSFTVLDYPILTSAQSVGQDTVDTTSVGFQVRVHQAELRSTDTSAGRADRQLAGLLGKNVADFSTASPDGIFIADQINFGFPDGGEFSSKNRYPDSAFPGIPGTTGKTENFVLEAIAWIEMSPGVYTFGVSVDDDAHIAVGSEPADLSAVQLLAASKGTSKRTFAVRDEGIYPFRLLMSQDSGSAQLEWWMEDSEGKRWLLNDPGSSQPLAIYSRRASAYRPRPYVSFSSPSVGETNVPPTRAVHIEIMDPSQSVDPKSITLDLDGTQLDLPPSAIHRTSAILNIDYDPSSPLTAERKQQMRLRFADSIGGEQVRTWDFETGELAKSDPSLSIRGQWDFEDGSLEATVGCDLDFIDPTLSDRYEFGTTTQFGIPGIAGKPARVLRIPYVGNEEGDLFRKIGLRMRHNIAPNAGGTKVNQWTLIMDLFWGNSGHQDGGPLGLGGILQTHDLENPVDADLFWRASIGSYGKGCCSPYGDISSEPGFFHARGEWARVIFAVDLASQPRTLAKYINGHLHREDIGGDANSIDSRFALPPEVFLFGDGDDNERTECFVNSIQIREGALSPEQVIALGNPSAEKISGLGSGFHERLRATRVPGGIHLEWDSSCLMLEESESLDSHPWKTIEANGRHDLFVPFDRATHFFRLRRAK